jgi:hypothetical protein
VTLALDCLTGDAALKAFGALALGFMVITIIVLSFRNWIGNKERLIFDIAALPALSLFCALMKMTLHHSVFGC